MSLKLQFDPNLEYQQEAINAVVDLFKGQTPKKSNFTVTPASRQMSTYDSNVGIGNKLELTGEEILKNLNEVQEKNGIKQSKNLNANPYLEFAVDMETGTGKTYVFLRTIMELNKKYGFKKFVIVVPSLAIKEGIHHSLKTTQSHMQSLYNNEIYDYFVYDSKNRDRLTDFATSDHIDIMIINIQAFNRELNLIYADDEKSPEGRAPIELVQETNPIVIIDEPQSAASTAKSKESIKGLNPMCTINYSATHKNPKNIVYRLNAVDAHDMQLVKQIEVVSFEEEDNYEKAYIRLISTSSLKSGIYSRIEFDKRGKSGIIRTTKRVKLGDDLYELSGYRDEYKGFQVSEIDTGGNIVKFTARPEVLTLDNYIGGISDNVYKKIQIESTIRAHLDKELRLNKNGIKVLSLFFLDRVDNYRQYNADGTYNKGKYALIFEQLFNKIIREDKYKDLREYINDIDEYSKSVHHGYFSQDKSGTTNVQYVETKTGNSQNDDYAYELIMKDKERLLSFDSDLKFIFSHSALREGWDNPNVFQICTLNETYSDIKKRQEIGRGLRLAVNQDGERQFGFDINTLTVIANESYEVFCDTLQKEYEDDAGIRFGYIENHTYANIIILEAGNESRLGAVASEKIVKDFKEKGYVDKSGKVLAKLKDAIDNDLLEIPLEYETLKPQIISRTIRAIEGINIKVARERKQINLNKQRYLSPEFRELWDKVKYKTRFQVEFNTEDLINKCAEEIEKTLIIKQGKITVTTASVKMKQGGIIGQAKEKSSEYILENISLEELPDIVTFLQNETDLTRQTIVDILIKSTKLNYFAVNPQIFMQEVKNIINSVKESFIVDGIQYLKIGDEDYYSQKLFENEDMFGYLNSNLIESNRGIHDYVIYDSEVEKNFVYSLETSKDVILYVKLPNWFKIPTPLGSYNPDWALLISESGKQKFYFVTETKSDTNFNNLRPSERKKIECGIEHFKALDSDVNYVVASDLDDVMAQIVK